MTKKDFLLPLGERNVNPESTDVLLSSKISERKRKEIERQEEIDEAAHAAKLAKLKKETTVADVEGEKAEKKSETSLEPKFKIEGGVRIDIDPQRDAKEAQEAAEKVRGKMEQEKKERDEKIEKLAADRDEKAKELQDTKLSVAMKEMTGSFNAALKDMNEKLEEVKAGADPLAMVNQFKALTKISEEMASMRGTSQAGDPSIQLAITKLQMDNARAEREFQARLVQEAKQWELDKEKMHDDRYFRQQDAARQQRKDEMFANAPAIIGGALAKGMMESEGQGDVSKAPKGKAGQHVEAGVGESGEFECTSCSQPVAIGPTAKVAVCSNCGTRFSIRRTESGVVAPEEE